jgi:hypothetical protein
VGGFVAGSPGHVPLLGDGYISAAIFGLSGFTGFKGDRFACDADLAVSPVLFLGKFTDGSKFN